MKQMDRIGVGPKGNYLCVQLVVENFNKFRKNKRIVKAFDSSKSLVKAEHDFLTWVEMNSRFKE